MGFISDLQETNSKLLVKKLQLYIFVYDEA